MKEVKFTNNSKLKALVDDIDYSMICKYKWLATKQRYGNKIVYIPMTSINGKCVRMSRMITNCPKDLVVHHENHNTLDNRRSNLKVCSRYENGQYKMLKTKKLSLYKGVSPLDSGKYKAVIRYKDKVIHIGTFESEEHAAVAYDIKARELLGEIAITNF